MKVSIVIGTYNRLEQIKRCVQSIFLQAKTPFALYITDAGSTDGTVEYLQNIKKRNAHIICLGKKIGQAKAYNEVFKIIKTPYTCWLSDDNEIINNSIDTGIDILEKNNVVGLVALKTKDVQGPFKSAPYIGGISSAGILNVNQGIVRTSLLQKIGGFSEEFRLYGIDSALTADVLQAGFAVVYTKKIGIYHYRCWDEDPNSENFRWHQEQTKRTKSLLEKKYTFGVKTNFFLFKNQLATFIKKLLYRIGLLKKTQQIAFFRTLLNILQSRYISIFDPLLALYKNYHLVQKIPKKLK